MLVRASFWALLTISLNATAYVHATTIPERVGSSEAVTLDTSSSFTQAASVSVEPTKATSEPTSSSTTPKATSTHSTPPPVPPPAPPTQHTSSTTRVTPPPPPPPTTRASPSTTPARANSTPASASPTSTAASSIPTSSSSQVSSTSTSSSVATSSTAAAAALPFKIPPHHGKNPKRGLGFSSPAPGDIINANQTNSVISWIYNWNNIPPDYLATSNIPYIPMQWGGVGASGFQNVVETLGATTILTFNEPDYVAEANMDPVDAANIWMQSIEPLKALGVRLGGPAVTASSTGRPWLNAFLAACTNCTIDFLPLHWYGEGVDGFYGYIFDVHTTFPQYPVWITEFADTSANVSDVANFLNNTINTLDTLDWVERYAWFGYTRPSSGVSYNFLDEDGGINALGQIYLEATTIHTEALPSGPSSTAQTVNGADLPGQAPPTSWPSVSGASKQLNLGLPITLAAVMLSSCLFGAFRTVW